MKDFLLGTGTQVLVEASPYDRIWGIGLGAEDPKAKHPSTWQGENLLGFALMDAREAIRNSLENHPDLQPLSQVGMRLGRLT